MKTSKIKLQLNRETLRRLDAVELRQAGGGSVNGVCGSLAPRCADPSYNEPTCMVTVGCTTTNVTALCVGGTDNPGNSCAV